MTNEVSFTIPGDPIPKARARAAIRRGRITHYTPDQTERYELAVAAAAKQAMGRCVPISGPVSLSVRITCAIPASWSKKRQEAAIGSPKVSRPDIDNYIKSIMDGCNGVLWTDDSQVTELCRCIKVYGEKPGVLVEVFA